MKKRMLVSILGISLITSYLTGCEQSKAQGENLVISDNETNITSFSNSSLSEFDSALISFMEDSGYQNKNYMISPTSFRAAIALAVAGADTETKDQLLNALGFKSIEELNTWYTSVSSSISIFDEMLKQSQKEFESNKEYYDDNAKAPDGAFKMENSIWRNTSSNGSLSKKYIEYVESLYDAKASNVDIDKITDTVNNWISQSTNGLIQQISSDLSYADLILVNTLYLRSSWIQRFYENATTEGNFTTANGTVVTKDFMHNEENYAYYEDESGKFVVLPMNGGINAVFILGDVDDIMNKLNNASFETVNIALPKFEIESSFSQNELVDFMMSRGAELPFTADADFSIMCEDASMYITDIIQKTKIKVDEDGIEAAAATAVIMTESAMEITETKDFTADEPFKYMITTSGDNPELLFYGQLVE